jgi:CheY-like chemotaxis protein
MPVTRERSGGADVTGNGRFPCISSGFAHLNHLKSVLEWPGGTTFVREPTIAGRVLVVEDDDAIRTMLLTVLEVAGYDVLGVRSGGDALIMLGEWQPDVIVLDLFPPLMDGYGLLEHRFASETLATIPIIAVTTSTASVPSAERLGVWAVLQRPHDVNHLKELIAAAIERGRAGTGPRQGGLADDAAH